MKWKEAIRTNYAQIFFVFGTFALMVVIGSIFVSNILQKESLAKVTVALDETEKTIRAYLREPKVAFDNIYTAVQDILDRGEPQDTVLQYLTQTTNLLSSQEEGVTGFLAVYGYIRNEFISGLEVNLGDSYIPQQRPWYQLAIRSRNAEYTAPYIDENTGSLIMSLAREIYGNNGGYYGVLSMDIALPWLVQYVESLQFAEGGYGMVVNQYLYTIVHPREQYRNMPLQELGSDYAGIADMLRAHRDVSAERVRDIDNTRVIIFFKQLYNGWFVGAVMPVKSYFSDLYFCIAVLAILGIVSAFILSFFLLRLAALKVHSEEESRFKTAFLARMSHEIRTPLNAVIGLSEIELQNGMSGSANGSLPESTRNNIMQIHQSGTTLLGIINDILDISKIEAGRLDIVQAEYDTASFINDTINLGRVWIGSRPINLVLEIGGDFPGRLFGDELRVRQILNNLLSNAIKYTQKGTVTLSALCEMTNDAAILRFRVQDTGIGILQEDMGKLFNSYTQLDAGTNRKTGGTGLGLTITKNLVTMMGGTVTVESEYGKGSVFTAEIKQGIVYAGGQNVPAIGEETAENLKKFRYAIEKTERVVRFFMPGVKALVVDDNRANLMVAIGLLAPYGLQIDTAESGKKAIELVKNHDYDIIFLDHMMPEMDGVETLAAIRELGKTGVPIVAMTANAMRGMREFYLEHGFDDYLSKPMSPKTLDEVIVKWLGKLHNRERVTINSEPLPANLYLEIESQRIDVLKHYLVSFTGIPQADWKAKFDRPYFERFAALVESLCAAEMKADTREQADALIKAAQQEEIPAIREILPAFCEAAQREYLQKRQEQGADKNALDAILQRLEKAALAGETETAEAIIGELGAANTTPAGRELYFRLYALMFEENPNQIFAEKILEVISNHRIEEQCNG